MRSTALAAFALLGLLACGERNPDQSYAGTARYRYEQGMEALVDENYLEAIKHFTFVKNKFAYSKYAALAELRIADAYFDQEKHAEAIDAYRTFIQGRPNHRDVPFAMWRIAESHFSQIPSDFILFPPSYEKDQAATRDALRALTQYVDRFPDDAHVAEARARIAEARAALCDHELYVARYYLGQDRPVSARGRLERVFAEFDDVADR